MGENKDRIPRYSAIASLAVVFLFAQLILSFHDHVETEHISDEGHHSSEECSICLAVLNLPFDAPPEAEFHAQTQTNSLQYVVAPYTLSALVFRAEPLPRAPPAKSFP